ncbi:hypothetical protein K8O65_05830 [Leptospira borgpetersenii]|nr:hypothetical protein [Leptospira borgpetersenii]UOZ23088.1 hypothetical protein K8O65_05830 [Leptospira borgpetersenii]UOZ26045.1 hypothetical protein K8O64_05835 [Leptospira borgpetersenii]UZN20856.1 hypothetical protein M0M86_07220 [Leptospira borgpetersenii]
MGRHIRAGLKSCLLRERHCRETVISLLNVRVPTDCIVLAAFSCRLKL